MRPRLGHHWFMVDFQEMRACELDPAPLRLRASMLLPSTSVLPNLQIIARNCRLQPIAPQSGRRGAVCRGPRCDCRQLYSITIGGARGVECERCHGGTVAKTTKACFSDTLQVTGVVAPRSEILVRPDREACRFRKCWWNRVTLSFRDRFWRVLRRRRASRAAARRRSPSRRLRRALSRRGLRW